jgi:hypothetical protein
LRHRDRQPGAGLEADDDAVADQLGQFAPAIAPTVAAIISEIAAVGPIASRRDEPRS